MDAKQSYTTFSGCDIAATFNGKVIGELQGVTYSISREKAPVYTMGSAEPRSFSRGKRGIAGTLVFTVFNRDALIEEFREKMESNREIRVQKFKANGLRDDNREWTYMSVDKWDELMNYESGATGNYSPEDLNTVSDLVDRYQPHYADELMPFDITLTFANEYGQQAVMVIYGVELINEGGGFSIDSVVSEKAYTYVARKIDHMRPVGENVDDKISATF